MVLSSFTIRFLYHCVHIWEKIKTVNREYCNSLALGGMGNIYKIHTLYLSIYALVLVMNWHDVSRRNNYNKCLYSPLGLADCTLAQTSVFMTCLNSHRCDLVYGPLYCVLNTSSGAKSGLSSPGTQRPEVRAKWTASLTTDRVQIVFVVGDSLLVLTDPTQASLGLKFTTIVVVRECFFLKSVEIEYLTQQVGSKLLVLTLFFPILNCYHMDTWNYCLS